MTYRYAGKKLSGIVELRNQHDDVPAVLLGSGTTLKRFDESQIPDSWPIVAINEAVGYGGRVDYWVLSDDPILLEYASRCPESTEVLAMHQATLSVEGALRKTRRAGPAAAIHTVNSMNKAKDYDNGFEFFSRGTVMIGAIEMLRWMGVKRFFCFGLDCYREEKEYYYDGRRPPSSTEVKLLDIERVTKIKPGVHIWVTSKLKRMVERLTEAQSSGLWEKIELFCVDSPYSQQTAIPKIDLEEFEDYKRKHKQTKTRTDRRKRRAEREKTVKTTEAEESELPEGHGDDFGSQCSTVGSGEGSEHPDPGQDDTGVLRTGDTCGADDEGDV